MKMIDFWPEKKFERFFVRQGFPPFFRESDFYLNSLTYVPVKKTRGEGNLLTAINRGEYICTWEKN